MSSAYGKFILFLPMVICEPFEFLFHFLLNLKAQHTKKIVLVLISCNLTLLDLDLLLILILPAMALVMFLKAFLLLILKL